MAYINAQETKIIRDELKAAFPYVKFSVTNDNHSSVNVHILEAPFDFNTSRPGCSYKDVIHYSVNDHWLTADDERHQQTATNSEGHSISQGDHEAYIFLRAVEAIITKKWWDKSDIQSDYFNTAFYFSISIGKWDRGFVRTEWPQGVDHLSDPIETPKAVEDDLSDIDGDDHRQYDDDEEQVDDEDDYEYPTLQERELALSAELERLEDPKYALADASSVGFMTPVVANHIRDGRLSFPVFLYKPVEGVPPSHSRIMICYGFTDIETGLAKGWKALDEAAEADFKAYTGYDIEEYPDRLRNGTY